MIPLRTGPAPLVFVFLVACSAAACDKKPDPPPAEPPAASATASSAPSTTQEASSTPSATTDAASVDASNGADAATDPKDAASPPASASSTGKTPAPAPSASGPKTYTCGTKPQPDCPLQAWMKSNANPPMAAADTPALGDVFDNIVKFAPPGYSNWASISRDGAKAARLGKLDGAKAACRGCHDQYKAKYRLAFRDRKI